MQSARHGACTQLALPLRHLHGEAVEAAAVAAIHPLPQTTVVGVAVVMGVVGGVGVACGLLVSAGHSLNLPFDGLIIANNCYKIKYKFITILLNRRPARFGRRRWDSLVPKKPPEEYNH